MITDTSYAAYSLPGAPVGVKYQPADLLVLATIAVPSILRTGTGSISVAAAADVALTDPAAPDPLGSAVICTAGQPVATAPQSSPFARVALSTAADVQPNIRLPSGVVSQLSYLLTGQVNPQGGG